MKIQQNETKQLSAEDLEAVTGGMMCVYESKNYSQGSTVTMANNQTKTCGSDGAWH